jgi:hypothetical protein
MKRRLKLQPHDVISEKRFVIVTAVKTPQDIAFFGPTSAQRDLVCSDGTPLFVGRSFVFCTRFGSVLLLSRYYSSQQSSLLLDYHRHIK